MSVIKQYIPIQDLVNIIEDYEDKRLWKPNKSVQMQVEYLKFLLTEYKPPLYCTEKMSTIIRHAKLDFYIARTPHCS